MDRAIIYLLAAAWVPILPAFLFYRVLPSDAQVDGPLGGLRVKLGGAFAGYFTLTVITMAFLRPSLATDETWTVKGRVAMEGIDADVGQLRLVIDPDIGTVFSDGQFHLQVRGRPWLQVEGAGYVSNAIDLTEQSADGGVISLAEPLQLSR